MGIERSYISLKHNTNNTDTHTHTHTLHMLKARITVLVESSVLKKGDLICKQTGDMMTRSAVYSVSSTHLKHNFNVIICRTQLLWSNSEAGTDMLQAVCSKQRLSELLQQHRLKKRKPFQAFPLISNTHSTMAKSTLIT